jgi:radical SAM protein with 4Fe4S-binding SPASM domain
MYSCPFSLNQNSRRALWEVTYQCNLACKHCFILENDAVWQARDMDLIACERMIVFLHSLGMEEVWLSGGEPLLNKNIFRIIERLDHHGIETSLSSNGILIDENVVKKIKLHIRYVHLSVDGNAFTHDRIRGMPGAFKKLTKAIDLLRKEKIALGASCVVSKHNKGQYEEIAAFAANKGIEVLSFYPPIDLGRGRQEVLTHCQLTQVLNELKPVEKKFSGRVKIELFRLYENKPLEGCLANKFLTVSPDGLIGPCPWLCKSRRDFFVDITQKTGKEVLSTINDKIKRANNERKKRLLHCGECKLSRTCKRGCLALSNAYDPLCVKLYD